MQENIHLQAFGFHADKYVDRPSHEGEGDIFSGAMIEFEQDVKAYSRYALEFDAPIRCELLYGDAHAAVNSIAVKYRLAPSYPRKFDIDQGLPRYQPIVDALQFYLPDGNRDPVQAVLDLTQELQKTYRREVVAGASKFLWFLWGRDILVYDSHSLKALQNHFPDLKAKDYLGYCSAWLTLFAEHVGEIAEECTRQGVSGDRSFHARVFDHFLCRTAK